MNLMVKDVEYCIVYMYLSPWNMLDYGSSPPRLLGWRQAEASSKINLRFVQT